MEIYNQTPQIKKIIEDDYAGFDSSYVDKKNFDNIELFKEYLLKIDMCKVLGLPATCNCIFHNDLKASAHINEYAGKYYYRCFGNCVHTNGINLIEIIKMIKNASYSDALKICSKLFKCKVNFESLARHNQKAEEIINSNARFLADIKTNAPRAYKRLKTPLKLLFEIYKMIENGDGYYDGDNSVVISFSNQYIENVKKISKVSNSLAILHYFCLIKRIPAFEMDSQRINKLYKVSSSGGAQRAVRLINTVKIKEYTGITFNNLEEKATSFEKLLIDLNIKIRNFSFTKLTEKHPFIAMQLFPQA